MHLSPSVQFRFVLIWRWLLVAGGPESSSKEKPIPHPWRKELLCLINPRFTQTKLFAFITNKQLVLFLSQLRIFCFLFWCKWKQEHPAGRVLTSDWFIHPAGRALTSDWSVNSFINGCLSEIFLVFLWTENSDWALKKCFLKNHSNQAKANNSFNVYRFLFNHFIFGRSIWAFNFKYDQIYG